MEAIAQPWRWQDAFFYLDTLPQPLEQAATPSGSASGAEGQAHHDVLEDPAATPGRRLVLRAFKAHVECGSVEVDVRSRFT